MTICIREAASRSGVRYGLPVVRLGFAVRTVGQPALNQAPHTDLSIALAQFADRLRYVQRIGVRFYRAAFMLQPAVLAQQLVLCAPQLVLLSEQLATHQIRVTLHLSHGVALGQVDPQAAAAALAEIEAAALLMQALDAQRPGGVCEGTLVVHVGGAGADARERFAARYSALSPQARRRLAVEHDSGGHSLGDLLGLHQRCGVAVVFDLLHWELYNPERLPLDLALGLALATWPAGMRAEVHLSSGRSEAHLLPGRAGAPPKVLPPRPGQHADFVDTAALIRLLMASSGLPAFDLMLEAKAGELAVLRLRHELAQRAPQLAQRVG